MNQMNIAKKIMKKKTKYWKDNGYRYRGRNDNKNDNNSNSNHNNVWEVRRKTSQKVEPVADILSEWWPTAHNEALLYKKVMSTAVWDHVYGVRNDTEFSFGPLAESSTLQLRSRVQKFPAWHTNATPNGKCCEGYTVPSMVRLTFWRRTFIFKF